MRLTRLDLVDIERNFVAIHRRGLYRLATGMQNSVENGHKYERRLEVYHATVIDMYATRNIILSGVLALSFAGFCKRMFAHDVVN